MRRILLIIGGGYLAVALVGHLMERSGATVCDCREDCWCKRPGLSFFRWAFPFGHHLR